MLKLLVPVILTAGLVSWWDAGTDPEVRRLRRHFATLERELVARDVSHLTPAQRAARERHVARLRAYARTGVFPKNTDFADRRVPYFIDRAGTRCAMAHLIEQSGGGDHVRRVADKMNNAYIAEIARDPELAASLFAWLDENGLTVEEAARIQPSYCGGWGLGFCPPLQPTPPTPTSYRPALTNGVASAALAASLMDWDLSRRTSGWVRVGAGALGLAVGVSAVNRDDDYGLWGIVNMGAGAVSLVLGLRGLTTSPKPQAVAAVAPWASPEGAAGMRVNLTF